MNGTEQKIRDQTIDKTMAKPVGVHDQKPREPHNLKRRNASFQLMSIKVFNNNL